MPNPVSLSEAAAESHTVPAFRALFERQQAYFATDATKPYDWRLDQLHRLTRMLSENETRLSDASKRDFKTAVQEHAWYRTKRLHGRARRIEEASAVEVIAS